MSWADRSRLGLLRAVIDIADESGRRNLYMHTLHTIVLGAELRRLGSLRRVLDFGCGTGRLLKVLSARCSEVYAVDTEPSMLRAAQRYAGRCASQIVQWDTGNVPLGDGLFDFVLCSSVLSVTTRDLFDVSLLEIARLSKAGGTLLILDQVSIERGLTLNSYGTALANAGFEIVRMYPIRTATSRITALVTRRAWIPEASFSVLAAIELALTRKRTFSRPAPYVEYAIVARRIMNEF